MSTSPHLLDNREKLVSRREFVIELNANLARELVSTKNKLAELEETQVVLKNALENFIRNNVAFLQNATTAKGKLNSIESELESMNKRLEKLEDNKKIRWNRSTTIISIITAIISTVAAIALGVLR